MNKIERCVLKDGLCAFFLTAIILLAAYIIIGIYPFGERDFVCSDAVLQYHPLIAIVAEKLKNGENLFISQKVGFGINLYAWASYILFSPFNLLFFFTNETNFRVAFWFVYILKLSFSAAAASLFFNKSRIIGTKGLVNVAFSVLYALGIFNVSQCRVQYMWLENVILLPLCCLCVEKLVNEEKIFDFTFVYFLCVMTNYYLSYITGLVSLIYLLYYTAVVEKDGKSIVKSMFRLALSAAIALGLSAFMLIPTLTAIKSGYYNMFYGNSLDNFVTLEPGKAFRALFMFVGTNITEGGYVNVYFGILPIVLAIMLILSKGRKKRERIAATCVFLFFIAALIYKPIYILMHFMRVPSGSEGRFAYGMAFMYIVLSMRSFKCLDKPNKAQIVVPIVFVIVGLNFALSYESTVMYLVSAVLITLLTVTYVLIVVYAKGKRKALLSAFAVAEAVVISLASVRLWLYLNVDITNEFQIKSKKAAEIIKENDKNFFRAENVMVRSFGGCQNAVAGFNSLEMFSSLANQKAEKVAADLGLYVFSDNKVGDSRYNSLVTDSIFGVKYVFSSDKSKSAEDMNGYGVYTNSRRHISRLYQNIYEDDEIEIYENKTVFPLMFKSEKDVLSCSDSFFKRSVYGAACKNQEMFLNSITGRNDVLYYGEEFDETEFLNCEALTRDDGSMHVKMNNLQSNGEFAASEGEIGRIVYKTKAKKDGRYFTYIWVEKSERNVNYKNVYVLLNDLPMMFDPLRYPIVLYDLGEFKKGDEIKLEIMEGEKEFYMMPPLLLEFNTEAFKAAAAAVQQNGLKNIREEKGNIAAESDFAEDSFVFTTLAYDEGYDVFIDGVKTEKINAMGAFLGYNVPKGKHEILIKYVSPGFKEGCIVTLATGVLVLILFCVSKRRKDDVGTELAKCEQGDNYEKTK